MDHTGNIEEALALESCAGVLLAAGADVAAARHGSELIHGSGGDGGGGWEEPAGADVANHVVAAIGGGAADEAAVVPPSGPANPAHGGRELDELPCC